MARGDRIAALVTRLAKRPAVVEKTIETYPRTMAYLASLPEEKAAKLQRPVEGSWMTLCPIEFRGVTESGAASMSRMSTHWNVRLDRPKSVHDIAFECSPADVFAILRAYGRKPGALVESAYLEAGFALAVMPRAQASAVLPGHAPAPAVLSSPAAG